MGFLTALLLTYFPEDEAFHVLRPVMCVCLSSATPSLPPSLGGVLPGYGLSDRPPPHLLARG